MKTVQVEITRADIEAGERMSPQSCPLARAVRRVLRTGLYVSVAPRDLTIINDMSGEYVGRFLHAGYDFISAFDSTRYGSPAPQPTFVAVDMDEKLLK